MPSTVDLPFLNYRQIVYKLPPPGGRNGAKRSVNKENTVDYSLENEDSNVDILAEQQEDKKMFQRKKVSAQKSSAKRDSVGGGKSHPQKSMDDLDEDQEEEELLNDRAEEMATLNTGGGGVTGNNDQKYYSMIDDNNASNRDASMLMMNMASIDSNSEFANVSVSASNTLNNKKNRKLKRVGPGGASTQQNESKDNVAFIEDNQFL